MKWKMSNTRQKDMKDKGKEIRAVGGGCVSVFVQGYAVGAAGARTEQADCDGCFLKFVPTPIHENVTTSILDPEKMAVVSLIRVHN